MAGTTNGQSSPGDEVLTFPCRIDIKVVGAHTNRFQAVVLEMISRRIGPERLLATSTRESRGGKYLAITVTVEAKSRGELDDLYQELSQSKHVLIAL